jgi:heme-degrading monooxygenase HmoA
MDEGRTELPYYAVIVTTRLSGRDPDGYAEAERRMIALAEQAPGYIGRETTRSSDGRDQTIVYYEDEASLRLWREDPEHRQVQRLGREVWYDSYEVRIARVEGAYAWSARTNEDGAAPTV